MTSNFTKLVRNTLGTVLIVFGANMFSHFLPIENYKDPTGYIFPIVGWLEIAIGALLLMKKWTALMLILLAPISINILIFHLFLDIPGIALALIVFLFNTALLYKYWPKYKPLLSS